MPVWAPAIITIPRPMPILAIGMYSSGQHSYAVQSPISPNKLRPNYNVVNHYKYVNI